MIDDLIRRLEAATEGSRELDGDIAEAIGLYRIERSDWGFWVRPADAPLAKFEYDASKHWVWASDCPRFTTSVDAARTLLSKDWHLDLRGVNAAWYAAINATAYGEETRGTTANGSTPALAICRAWARARAAMSGTEGER